MADSDLSESCISDPLRSSFAERSLRQRAATQIAVNSYPKTIEGVLAWKQHHSITTALGTIAHLYKLEDGKTVVDALTKVILGGKEGQLFIDPDFPHSAESIQISGLQSKKEGNVIWLPARDIFCLPQLFESGSTTSDVQQGELADGWLCSTLSSLAKNANIIFSNMFYPKHYNRAGVFGIRLNFNKIHYMIVVDSFFPTVQKKLIFGRNGDSNEMWFALVEKAMAKIVGNYAKLQEPPMKDMRSKMIGPAMELICGGRNAVIEFAKHADEHEWTTKIVEHITKRRLVIAHVPEREGNCVLVDFLEIDSTVYFRAQKTWDRLLKKLPRGPGESWISAGSLKSGAALVELCTVPPGGESIVHTSKKSNQGFKGTATLQFRGIGAAGYGSLNNPQFLLEVRKTTSVVVTVNVSVEHHSLRFIVLTAPEGIVRLDKELLDLRIFTSKYLLNSSVSEEIPGGLQSGRYVIVCMLEEKGVEGTVSVTVECPNDSDAQLSGKTVDSFNQVQCLGVVSKFPTSVSQIGVRLPKWKGIFLNNLHTIEAGMKLVDSLLGEVDTTTNPPSVFDSRDFPKNMGSVGTVEFGEIDWTASRLLKEEGPVSELFDFAACHSPVVQGLLDNSWFCSIVSALANRPEAVKNLFYPATFNMHGVYGIKICVQGSWFMIVVDGYLPTLHGKLLFAQNLSGFWFPLLEKAYAIAFGSYHNLVRAAALSIVVSPMKLIFECLTGGRVSKIDCTDADWFSKLQSAELQGKLAVVTRVSQLHSAEWHASTMSHCSYAILHVMEGSGLKLLLLRATSAKADWIGPWCPLDANWGAHPEAASLCQRSLAETDFWMAAEDFQKQFFSVDLCEVVITPDSSKQNLQNGAVQSKARQSGCCVCM